MRRAFLARWVLLTLAPAILLLHPAVAGAAATICAASTFSGGFSYAGAVVSGGHLLTWGRNSEGQLGLGFRNTLDQFPTPVITTTGLTTTNGVWAGVFTTFAVDSTGQLWAWGSNDFNQRGNNTGNSSPQPVVGPVNVVSVGAGFGHTIVATADGTLWGWGEIIGLGLPGNFPTTDPVTLPGPAGAAKVTAGDGYSLVLTSGGVLYSTGTNDHGQLGLGDGVPQSRTFQPIVGLPPIADVAASDSVGTEFTVALDQNGHVYTFGSNFYGQLGNGSQGNSDRTSPAQVPGLDSMVQVAAGNGHVLALKSDFTVWSWGENESGQLGNGSNINSPTPTQVSFPAGVRLVRIATGSGNSMALDDAGHLWVWGNDVDGALGTGFIGRNEVRPVMLNLAPISTPCTPAAPPGYDVQVNGYSFPNAGDIKAPSYERMAAFYPSSKGEMYLTLPFGRTIHSAQGELFYNALFKPTYVGYPLLGGAGLCYGMVASNQFLFSQFPTSDIYGLYPSLASNFSGDPTVSASPSDPPMEDFIDRYHSRQLAASGALASIESWTNTELTGGDFHALDTIADSLAGGKTEWVGLGPSGLLLLDGDAGKLRFAYLFSISHSVLAYGVDRDLQRIKVYDPNAPGDQRAYIQIVSSPINPRGGIMLVHGDGSVSYGGGVDASGQDHGQPGEWTLMPLPKEAFTDAGIIPNQDNLHWLFDLPGGKAAVSGASLPGFAGTPVFRMLGDRAPDPAAIELLPDGTGLESLVLTSATGAQTFEAVGAHGALVTQTDAGAAGTTHQVSIAPDAGRVVLSNANSSQQYSVTLDSDFLPSSGRRFTLDGVSLIPGGVLDISTDPTYSSLFLTESAMADQHRSLLLEQLGVDGGSANVTVTIPGGGSRAQVFVADWTSLGQSLIFEVITAPNGQVTGLLLQDNGDQRSQLASQLLQALQHLVDQVSDQGTRNSLQAKLDNAIKQVAAGNPGPAANALEALDNSVSAQNGKVIPADLANSMQATTEELIGLLRTPLV